MAENRLARESSTYLKGAAHQPVEWYPWGEDAFRRAKELDRPILLDIGATWCHWCHVIDRESYEDPELASVINENFVAIKVDRDERPDIDARYQQAVGAIAGQGGWPLTAFLTPDGKVFYGGTYFPPKDSHGRPSFRRVLLAMADAYRSNKADTLKEAEALHRALAEGRVSLVDEGAVNEAMLKESLDSLRGQFNPHLSAAMKLTTTQLTQEFSETAMEILGPWAALIDDPRAPFNGRWAKQWLGDRSMTIAGGTSEVQRNIVAQRILGLPRDRGATAAKS